MSSNLVVPEPQPYLKFLATLWHSHGCPLITKAYFDTTLKPHAQHLEHGDWRERGYAFEESLEENDDEFGLEGVANWLLQEINQLSDQDRNAYHLACDSYGACDLCCQVSFFVIKRFTWRDMVNYLAENGTEEPEW